jgi:hypothetical protein
MKRILWLFIVGFAISFCALTTGAQAQATRTWISGVGDDANPCSRTAPCKTFPGAISKTANCGEIDALDPGGFGAVTITKSITLDGGGGQNASILANGTPGITINNSDTTCRSVIVRNLRIVGNGSTLGTIGVNIVSSAAGAVSFENDAINNFSQTCITLNASQPQLVSVTGSVLEFCAGGGLVSSSPAATNRVNVVNTVITGNSIGVTAHANTDLFMQGDEVSNNTTGGVLADTNSTAKIDIDRSSVVNNLGYGIHATAGSFIGLSNTVVTYNSGQGLLADGGATLVTWSNNYVAGNNPDGSRTGTLNPI